MEKNPTLSIYFIVLYKNNVYICCLFMYVRIDSYGETYR